MQVELYEFKVGLSIPGPIVLHSATFLSVSSPASLPTPEFTQLA